MKIKEYQEQAKRTCPTLENTKLDLSHMVLGIFSEYEEYIVAKHNDDIINQSEECSDIMWYIANYCTFRGYDLESLWNVRVFNGKDFTVNVSILQDYIKKHIAYNKSIDSYKECDTISHILYNLQFMYGTIDWKQSLQNNINKLKIRFPEKFDENLAKNRNLELERKELEK